LQDLLNISGEMSDELIPRKEIYKLCQLTNVTEELLRLLEGDGMILKIDRERIVSTVYKLKKYLIKFSLKTGLYIWQMTKDAKFDRASILYDLLKRRHVSDKPKIIQYLRDSSNTDAANIIEGNNEIPECQSSSLTAKLPLVPGG